MNLTEIISQKIKEEFESNLNAYPDSNIRLAVNGFPRNILESILSKFKKDDGIKIDDGSVVHILLINDDITFGPEEGSGECHPGYLISRRGGQNLIVLVPPEAHLNRSMVSSVLNFGLEKDTIANEQLLIDDPFYRTITKALQRKFDTSDNLWKKLEHILSNSIEQLEKAYLNPSQKEVWNLIDSISELDPNGDDWTNKLISLCGYPSSSTLDKIGNNDHLNCLDSLISFMGNNGFNESCKKLIDEAEEEYHEPIEQLFKHLSQKCDTVADFEECPPHSFRPITDINEQIPSWWDQLDFETLHRLVKESSSYSSEKLTVKCTNGLRTNNITKTVVRSTPKFEIPLQEENFPTGTTVKILQGKPSNESEIERVDIPTKNWEPPSIPYHESLLRYNFVIADNDEINQTHKIVSLDHFGPGIIIDCPTATQNIKLPKVVKNKESTWEVDVYLQGIGIHEIVILASENINIPPIAKISDSTLEDTTEKSSSVRNTEDSYWKFTVKTDEESVCQLELENSSGEKIDFIINLYAEPVEVQGVDNEFERLIAKNTKSNTSAVVEPKWNKFIFELEKWLLDNSNSCYPLIISDDYEQVTGKPNWKNSPVWSKTKLSSDPRPSFKDWNVPNSYIEARSKVLNLLKNELDSNSQQVIEQIQLGKSNEQLEQAITDYLKEYLEWLNKNRQDALLSDIILVIPNNKEDYLEFQPEAIIVSPLHPLKLAWHHIAHRSLWDAISSRQPCPAASVLNPYNVPDHLELEFLTPTNDRKTISFISTKSNSPYWNILWNGEKLDRLNKYDGSGIWSNSFGLTVGATSSGFNEAQVERAINDARKIHIAKSRLGVSIHKNMGPRSSVNDGIIEWCNNNLNENNENPWKQVGELGLDIYDFRGKEAQPAPPIIANLTKTSESAVKWFRPKKDENTHGDLSIIEHFSIENPHIENKSKHGSPISRGSLIRHRLRNTLNIPNGDREKPVKETRIGQYHASNSNPSSILDLTTEVITEFEKTKNGKSEYSKSLIFTPSTHTITEQLKSSRYCAISSSSVGVSSFLDRQDNRLLWDYDLPSYGNVSGENYGYYLLVEENETLSNATKKSVNKISNGLIDDKNSVLVSDILQEVARRGIPTLKQLASTGSESTGELGILIALRILQDEYIAGSKSGSIIPIIQKEGEITKVGLVVPVDPFQEQLEALMRGFKKIAQENKMSWRRTLNRPDLLVFAINYSNKEKKPINLKITPVEVKTRTFKFSEQDCEAALNQASEFGEFLKGLLNYEDGKNDGVNLWTIARQELLTSLMSFGFSSACILPQIQENNDEWMQLYQNVIGELLSGQLTIDVDTKGRLIVIDKNDEAKFHHLDEKGFYKTIYLGANNIPEILENKHSNFSKKLITQVEEWDFYPENRTPTKSTSIGKEEVKEKSSEDVKEPIDEEKNIDSTKKREKETDKEKKNKRHEKNDITSQGVKFPVGKTLDHLEARDKKFWPGNTDLTQLNVGIVGDLGTGKTQLTKSLIHKITQSASLNRSEKINFLIFDYKNDYSKSDFIDATSAKVVDPFNIPVNLFDTSTASGGIPGWIQRQSFFTDVLMKIYSGIGPVQQNKIRDTFKTAYDNAELQGHQAPLMKEIREIYHEQIDGSADSVYNILTKLTDYQMFSDDRDKIVPFSEFFDGVVVINLAKLGQDDQNKNLLVAIFLNLFYEYMLQIDKKDYFGPNGQYRVIDSMLLVDEANHIMKYNFDVLNSILLEGREFGVGVLLASQFLSHFETRKKDYREPLNTWFLHKVPNIKPKDLDDIGLPEKDKSVTNRIRKLKVHECLYKSLNSNGEFIRGKPFYELDL